MRSRTWSSRRVDCRGGRVWASDFTGCEPMLFLYTVHWSRRKYKRPGGSRSLGFSAGDVSQAHHAEILQARSSSNSSRHADRPGRPPPQIGACADAGREASESVAARRDEAHAALRRRAGVRALSTHRRRHPPIHHGGTRRRRRIGRAPGTARRDDRLRPARVRRCHTPKPRLGPRRSMGRTPARLVNACRDREAAWLAQADRESLTTSGNPYSILLATRGHFWVEMARWHDVENTLGVSHAIDEWPCKGQEQPRHLRMAESVVQEKLHLRARIEQPQERQERFSARALRAASEMSPHLSASGSAQKFGHREFFFSSPSCSGKLAGNELGLPPRLFASLGASGRGLCTSAHPDA